MNNNVVLYHIWWSRRLPKGSFLPLFHVFSFRGKQRKHRHLISILIYSPPSLVYLIFLSYFQIGETARMCWIIWQQVIVVRRNYLKFLVDKILFLSVPDFWKLLEQQWRKLFYRNIMFWIYILCN
jgi:hypothetical protein